MTKKKVKNICLFEVVLCLVLFNPKNQLCLVLVSDDKIWDSGGQPARDN